MGVGSLLNGHIVWPGAQRWGHSTYKDRQLISVDCRPLWQLRQWTSFYKVS